MSEGVFLTSKLFCRIIAPNKVFYEFICPACNTRHVFYVGLGWGSTNWEFNGDKERPTFSPSLLLNGNPKCLNPGMPRCHLNLVDGKIQYHSDSSHVRAGQTVDMVDIPGAEIQARKPPLILGE